MRWLWRNDSAGARAARAALAPLAAAFRAGTAARNVLYDRRILKIEPSPIPVASVGNIAVGGAGKTPFAAWLARQLADRGAAPAIVMRGYGGDEPLVHRALNRAIPVFVDPDRVAGVLAAARAGCDLAVLDDAFQHRRAARDEDIVLISADAWADSMLPLPAGPWREPASALRRATLIVVTRKSATPETAARARSWIAEATPATPVATARLSPHDLRTLGGDVAEPLASLRGRRVLAVAAVADPDPFFEQLESLGATVTRRPFGDHHWFSARDAAALRAAASRHDALVCTLKDAVKLAPLWSPDAPTAWYVSQAVTVEDGAAHVSALIQRLLAARPARMAGRSPQSARA